MTKVKKEKSALKQQRKYAVGTKLAVDLYANGNFFEAVLKNYRTDKRNKDEKWAYMQYLDDKETEGWVDLNITRVKELSDENILTQDDCAGKNLTEDEKGFLGRRLTVLWLDDARYTGTITKTMTDTKHFVFITYDNGDKCWYDLAPECEEDSRYEESESASNKRSSRKATTKPAKKVKKESTNSKEAKNDSDSKYEMARKELEKKYPIGCTVSVDIYHDEHYHEAIVKKYVANATKKQQDNGEQWVYIQFLDSAKTKQWIDLSCIKAVKMTKEKTLRLNDLKPGQDKGFLGKRIMVVWLDGNKYRGIATRCAKDNKHFVFIEYDDGDECWCDLQRESEWCLEGDESFESDNNIDDDEDENDDDDTSSEESNEE
jgi:hypothetical protein